MTKTVAGRCISLSWKRPCDSKTPSVDFITTNPPSGRVKASEWDAPRLSLFIQAWPPGLPRPSSACPRCLQLCQVSWLRAWEHTPFTTCGAWIPQHWCQLQESVLRHDRAPRHKPTQRLNTSTCGLQVCLFVACIIWWEQNLMPAKRNPLSPAVNQHCPPTPCPRPTHPIHPDSLWFSSGGIATDAT